MKIDFSKALKMVDILPGQKRTVISLFAVGMAMCQSMATWVGPEYGHVFSSSEWGSVIALWLVAFQIKLNREEGPK